MTRDQLLAMTIAGLRTLAKDRGLSDLSALKRKDQLVDALLPLLSPAAAMSLSSAAPAGSSAMAPAVAAAPRHQGPDPGLPIPDRYGIDRIVLMVQDPTHVFAYWEISTETMQRIDAAAGGATTPVLVVEGDAGSEQREVDLRGGNYYLSVAPGGTYRARLALRDRSGALHALVADSNPVTTPAAGPSWRSDEAWMEVAEHWEEWLAQARPGSSESSLSRFMRRRLEGRTVEVSDTGLAEVAALSPRVGLLAAIGQSSAVLARPAMGEWSSHALAVGAQLSSWGLLSSGSLSSFNLSSHALTSSGFSSHNRWQGEPTLVQIAPGLTPGGANPAPATVVPGAPAAAAWADVPVSPAATATATAAAAPGGPPPAAPTPPMRPGHIRGADTVKPDQGRRRPGA